MEQAELFDTASKFPPGLRYAAELISHAQEEDLVNRFQELEFKPFEFHGFLGKRRIVSFGGRYDFGGGVCKRRTTFRASSSRYADERRPSRRCRPATCNTCSSRNINRAQRSAGTRTA